MRVEHIGEATPIVAIYALCEPDWTPRYIGKTVQHLHERHKAHIRVAKRGGSLPVARWLRKKIAAGDRLAIKLIEYVHPPTDWREREAHWIAHYRAATGRLLNLTSGGEGLPGHTFSAEHRQKIAASLRTGSHFNCESCGTRFWRKLKDILKGDCRFCTRACYASSLKGISRPVPRECKERGIAAAAAKKRAQTHCKRGHPYSAANVFITSNGARGCKECRKIHKAAYRERCRG